MFESEQRLTLAEAADKAPGRPHVSSLWRYCRYGIRAANGMRIHLEHARFGSRIYTSVEALQRFAQRLADADREHFEHDSDVDAVESVLHPPLKNRRSRPSQDRRLHRSQ